jgi:hypothetical protein
VLSTKDYGRLAITIVTTDRSLATALAQACRKNRPVRPQLVLLEAALRDALSETVVSREAEEAAKLIREASNPAGRRRRK